MVRSDVAINLFYLALLLASCGYAFTLGGEPERIGMAIVAANAVLSFVAVSAPPVRFQGAEIGIFAVDVAAFLGISTAFTPETADRHNVTRHPPRIRAVEQLVQWRPAKATVTRLVPARALTRVKEFVRRQNSAPPVFPADVRRRLADVYRDDVALVEQLTGRDLSAWRA